MGRNLTGGSAVTPPSSGSGSSSSSSSSSSDDPRKEGLPCIATWTMQDDNARRYNCVIYDSSGSQMGSPWAVGMYSSPSDYYGGQIADKYWGYSGDNGNPYRTNSNLTSNSTTYRIKSTTYSSHMPMHAMMNVAPTGMFSSIRYTSGQSMVRTLQYMGTQVLPEGVRPRINLTRSGRWFYRCRALQISIEAGAPGGERIDLWQDAGLVALFGQNNISPKDLSGGSSQDNGTGAFGYNERTKTFVIIWNNNSTNVRRFTRYKLTKNLNDMNYSLREIFESASSVETSTNISFGWANSSEGNRWQVTVGDNDYIRCSQFQPSQAFRTWLFNPDFTAGTGFSEGSGQYQHSNTTSYGIEQGWEHIGATNNATWDNKWQAHYSHYYYYGCGISAFITSTEDPQLVYKMQYSDQSDGNPLHAWGKTGWIMPRSTNSDSADHRYYNIDFKNMKTTKDAYDAGAGKYHTYQEFDQPSIGSNISINDYANWFPSHGWYSTNYPTFLNVSWWPTNDGKTSYPGDHR